MTYLGALLAPTFAVALLVALPALTLLLLQRAGIRGWKLCLSALPAVCLFLGGYVFHWFMGSDLSQNLGMNELTAVIIAKNLGLVIGAISPLLILAILKWPALDTSTSPETFS